MSKQDLQFNKNEDFNKQDWDLVKSRLEKIYKGGGEKAAAKQKEKGKFHLPYINARYIFPILIVLTIVILETSLPNYFSGLMNLSGTEAEITFKLSSIVFWIICLLLSIGAYLRNWSLIPLLGLVTCLYLLTGMTAMNWAWFAGWLLVGLVIYFTYFIPLN
jgi:hypothetical protein